MDEFEVARNLNLTEDIFQMVLPSGRILDVGWFPMLDLNGHFLGVVVQPHPEFHYDWDNPVARVETPCLDLLLRWVTEQIIAEMKAR